MEAIIFFFEISEILSRSPTAEEVSLISNLSNFIFLNGKDNHLKI